MLTSEDKERIVHVAFSAIQRELLTPLAAWDFAQGILDPYQRVDLSDRSQLPDWYISGLRKRKDALLKAGSQSFPKPKAPEPESPPDLQGEILSVLREMKGELANIRELLRRMQPSEDTEIVTRVEKKERTPRVLILGILPSQYEVLQGEFCGIFDLSYTKEVGRAADMARGADYVVAMTSKMSHSLYDVAKTNSRDLRLATGGVTSIRKVLEEIWVERESSAEPS